MAVSSASFFGVTRESNCLSSPSSRMIPARFGMPWIASVSREGARRRRKNSRSASIALAPTTMRKTAQKRKMPLMITTGPRPFKKPIMRSYLNSGYDAHGDDIYGEQNDCRRYQLRENRDVHDLGIIVRFHQLDYENEHQRKDGQKPCRKPPFGGKRLHFTEHPEAFAYNLRKL